jgi:hypothetical protein
MATAEEKAQFQLDNWQHALAVAKQTGVDPRIVMAQAAIESDWGTKAPGNNLFGIKGPGQVLPTSEAGPDGKLVPTTASFSTYPDQATSFSHYASLPIVQKIGQGPDYGSQIAALGKSGYATDPNYASKIDQTAQSLTVPQDVQASTLPLYTKPIGSAPVWQTAQTPIADPRTAGDADLGGYSTAANQPSPALMPDKNSSLLAMLGRQSMSNVLSQSQGLLAQANTPAPPPMAVPMLQAVRPRVTIGPPVIPGLRGLLG